MGLVLLSFSISSTVCFLVTFPTRELSLLLSLWVSFLVLCSIFPHWAVFLPFLIRVIFFLFVFASSITISPVRILCSFIYTACPLHSLLLWSFSGLIIFLVGCFHTFIQILNWVLLFSFFHYIICWLSFIFISGFSFIWSSL